MHAHLVEQGIRPQYRGQVQQVRRELILASLKDSQGYRGMLFGINEAGEAVLLTFWESELALSKARPTESVGKFLVGSPVESVGQVVGIDSMEGQPRMAHFTITPVIQIAAADALKLSREIAGFGRQLPGFVCWVWIETHAREAATVSLWESYANFDKDEAVWLDRALYKIATIAAGASREAKFDVVRSELPSIIPVP
jgi:hypothetical protein